MNSKQWYTSITIWGGILATVSTSIQTITSTLDANVGTHLATNPIVTGIVALIGAIMAIVGRFKADTTIAPVVK